MDWTTVAKLEAWAVDCGCQLLSGQCGIDFKRIEAGETFFVFSVF